MILAGARNTRLFHRGEGSRLPAPPPRRRRSPTRHGFPATASSSETSDLSAVRKSRRRAVAASIGHGVRHGAPRRRRLYPFHARWPPFPLFRPQPPPPPPRAPFLCRSVPRPLLHRWLFCLRSPSSQPPKVFTIHRHCCCCCCFFLFRLW